MSTFTRAHTHIHLQLYALHPMPLKTRHAGIAIIELSPNGSAAGKLLKVPRRTCAELAFK